MLMIYKNSSTFGRLFMSKREKANNYIESKTDAFGECDADSGLWLVKYEIDGNTITWDSTLEQVSSADATGCNVAVIQAGKIWTRDDCFIDTELIKEMIAFYDAIYNLSPLEETMWEKVGGFGYHSAGHSSDLFAIHFCPHAKEVRWCPKGMSSSVVIKGDGSIAVPNGLNLTVPQLLELIEFWKAIYGDSEGV